MPTLIQRAANTWQHMQEHAGSMGAQKDDHPPDDVSRAPAPGIPYHAEHVSPVHVLSTASFIIVSWSLGVVEVYRKLRQPRSQASKPQPLELSGSHREAGPK